MGIDISKLSKDSPLRKKVEEVMADKSDQTFKAQLQMVAMPALQLLQPFNSFREDKLFKVKPMGKPRMTRADAWKDRPVVLRYRAFCDQIALQVKNFKMPIYNIWVIFYYPMPESWSDAEKQRKEGRFHMQRPDKDNMEKALLDALMTEDSTVADARITKIWCYQGEERIEIHY